MRLLTRVHGGENAAASRYAVVDIDRALTDPVLAWRSLAKHCKAADPQFHRVTFWAPPADWFGAEAWIRIFA